jgi:hypothetical protein
MAPAKTGNKLHSKGNLLHLTGPAPVRENIASLKSGTVIANAALPGRGRSGYVVEQLGGAVSVALIPGEADSPSSLR